jgi:hypothetical protein
METQEKKPPTLVLKASQSVVLELAEFLRDGEKCIQSDVLDERAKELGGLTGVAHAQRMLEQNKSGENQIPKEWRKHYLVFPDTKMWRNLDGRGGLPCLVWGGGGWDLLLGRLDGDWGEPHRLVRCK